MAVFLCVIIVLCLPAYFAAGTQLSCHAENAVELVENKTDNVVTCSDVGGPSQSVLWMIEYPDYGPDTTLMVGLCQAGAGDSCTGQPVVGFTPRRPSGDVSVMTIDETKVLGYMFGNNIVCSAGTRATCNIDHVYPSEVSGCTVQFVTPNNAKWTVTGHCDVTKAYSLLNRYSCRLYQRRGMAETRVGEAILATTNHTSSKYVNGSCDITVPFPSDGGRYSYRFVISPGLASVNAVFFGTDEIRQPSPNHDCPRYVAEGQSYSCTCGGDVGSPPGVAQWLSTGTSELTVSSAMVGRRQTCHVLYNNATISPIYYTAELARQTSVTHFTLNFAATSLTVNASDTVTLTCRADGRPTPGMTLIHPGGDVIAMVPQDTPPLVNEVRSLSGDVTVRCHDAGVYSCNARNGAGGTKRRDVTLSVQCSPQRDYPTPERPPIINFNSNTKQVAFNLVACPTPGVSSIGHLEPDGTLIREAANITFTSSCYSSDPVFRVTCTITVATLTSELAAGFYRATVSNALGSVELDFEVAFEDAISRQQDGCSLGTSNGTTAGITVAVMLAVMAAVVAVVIVWLRRRNWTLPCAARAEHMTATGSVSSTLQRHTETARPQPTSAVYELEDDTGAYTNDGLVEPEKSQYERLQFEDVGQKSAYSGLSAACDRSEPRSLHSTDSACSDSCGPLNTDHYANLPHSG